VLFFKTFPKMIRLVDRMSAMVLHQSYMTQCHSFTMISYHAFVFSFIYILMFNWKLVSLLRDGSSLLRLLPESYNQLIICPDFRRTWCSSTTTQAALAIEAFLDGTWTQLFDITSNARLHWLLQRCVFMKSKSTRWINWMVITFPTWTVSCLSDEWLL